MGWDFTHGASRADIVHDLVKNKPGEKHALVGNHLWVVWTYAPLETPTACLYLLGKSGPNWGYKDIHEEMHPYYYTCPKSLFKLLGPPCGQYSRDWREAQERAYARDAWLKRMRPGDFFGSDRCSVTYVRGHETLYRKFPKGRIAGLPLQYGAMGNDMHGVWAIRKRDAVPVPVYREEPCHAGE